MCKKYTQKVGALPDHPLRFPEVPPIVDGLGCFYCRQREIETRVRTYEQRDVMVGTGARQRINGAKGLVARSNEKFSSGNSRNGVCDVKCRWHR